MFSDAVTCYSAGNDAIKGKKAFLYAVAVIVYLLSVSISLLQFALPAQRETIAEGIELISMMINDPEAFRDYGRETEDTGYKSQGQLMVEKYEREEKMSNLRMQNNIFKGVSKVYEIVFSNILGIGVCSIYINIVKGKGDKVSMKDIFNGFSSGNYLQKMLALFLKGLAVSVAYALCVIPGMILCYALAFVDYLMADDPRLSFTRAFEISWKASSGYKLKLFAIDVIAFIPTLICIIICLIGIKIIPIEMILIFAVIMIIVTIAANIIVLPYRKAAIATIYTDAKGVAKSYGIIRELELFDPEEYDPNDSMTRGMTFYG